MVNYWKQWAIWWRKSKIKGKMVGAWANYIILGTIIGRTNDRANNEGYGVEAFVWDHKPPKISWIFLAPPMQENPCPMDRFRRRSRHAAMWPVEHAGLAPNNLAHQLQSPEGGTRAEGLNSRNGLQPQAQPRQPCGSSLGLLWRAITCTKRMRSECLNKAITCWVTLSGFIHQIFGFPVNLIPSLHQFWHVSLPGNKYSKQHRLPPSL